jgi:eukaryotic-like serine/threonine-protein kinase
VAQFTGQFFAGYEIIARLGQGGMGSVYKARQPKLDRLVALKVMSSELAVDPDFVARFKREASAAASLSHPNIVQVYAAGEYENTPFIAMEFVDGDTLKQHIERHGRLDPREAIAVVVYVTRALQYAWNRVKLIHRDIKPDNIFLSRAGEVKVGDLGLAKTVGGAATSLTQTGMMMGSPHYISPEQARGDSDIDFRADIYSLGCTFFHMLTGQPPYTGTDPLSVISKHVNDPPPAIFKVWPACPIPVALLVGRMLSKRRHERPKDYEDLIEQLEGLREKLKSATAAEPAKAPLPASSPSTPRPVGVRAMTSRPVMPVMKKTVVGNWKWMMGGIAGIAAVAMIVGGVWRFAGGTVETRTMDLGEGVTIALSVIPPGEFLLGSTREERTWAMSNRPRQEDVACEGDQPRKTTIKNGFWIGQTEVTVAQWRRFAGATGYVTEAEKQHGQAGGPDWQNPKSGFQMTESQAVTWISWNDAVAFCNWLDQMERESGRLPEGWRVRLPTEAEWEYACRAGASSKFWWGDSVEDGRDRLNLAGKESRFDFIAPVDSFGERGRNRFGLADMLGNAREWCLDEFDPEGAHEDLWTGNPLQQVARGGCVFRGPAIARCAYREKLRRDFRASCSGFRVVAGVEPGAQFAALVASRGGGSLVRKKTVSSSEPSTLFDGRDTSAWQQRNGGSCHWPVIDGALVAGQTDLDSRAKFRDFELHVEFAVSRDPKQGNSGIYLQGRYEVQILDSFGKPADDICCGSIFRIQAPAGNVSKPADEWQSYDITFHAARFNPNGVKTANARVSVIQNGRIIHNNVEIPRSTGKGDPESAAPGPIRLQGYGSPVRFRNIHIRPLNAADASASGATTGTTWQNAINLLSRVDVSQDATSGKWVVAPDGLVAADVKNMSQKIQPPYQPPEEYDYRVSFTPMTGNADVAIGLTAAGRSFVFYMKKFTNDHCLGFEAIDGKPIANGPTAHRFPHLEMGRRYTVVVEVRKNGLRGYLDDQLVAEWATDYHDMSAWPVWRFKDDTLLGFGCSLSTVAFQEARLREVTGKGWFTRDAATADAPSRSAWISKDATYIVSSATQGRPSPNLLNGIGGGQSVSDSFAFHTRENDLDPHIVINLGRTCAVDALEIVNRKRNNLERARTLTVWIGPEVEGPWAEVWRATEARPEWQVKLQTPVVAKFVKIGLREPVPLHLWSVKVFGSASGAPTQPVANGSAWKNAINLLPLIDPQKDSVAGDWKTTADGLVLEAPKQAGVLDLPYAPPEEYDFEIEFTPTSGGRNVNQYLTVAGHSFAWKVNLYGRTPPIHGIDLLDGKLAKDRDEAVVQKPLTLEIGRRCISRVEVRRGSLRALVNGEEYLQWSGSFGRLSKEPIYSLNDEHHIGVGSYNRGVVFHRIEVREVTGKGQFTRSAPAP